MTDAQTRMLKGAPLSACPSLRVTHRLHVGENPVMPLYLWPPPSRNAVIGISSSSNTFQDPQQPLSPGLGGRFLRWVHSTPHPTDALSISSSSLSGSCPPPGTGCRRWTAVLWTQGALLRPGSQGLLGRFLQPGRRPVWGGWPCRGAGGPWALEHGTRVAHHRRPSPQALQPDVRDQEWAGPHVPHRPREGPACPFQFLGVPGAPWLVAASLQCLRLCPHGLLGV